MKAETGVPTAHEIVNILSKEPLGLGAESFFNGIPNLNIVKRLDNCTVRCHGYAGEAPGFPTEIASTYLCIG